MEKNTRDVLTVITAVLEMLNSTVEELENRVNTLENEYFYTTIKIPINATNGDVIRKVFRCSVNKENEAYINVDIDEDTAFRKSWFDEKYKGGVQNEAD